MKHIVTVWYQDNWKTACLVKEGTKYNHFVLLDGTYGVVVRKLPTKEGYKLDSNVYTADPIAGWLRVGGVCGISKAAKSALEV